MNLPVVPGARPATELLLLEDDPAIAQTVQFALQREAFASRSAAGCMRRVRA